MPTFATDHDSTTQHTIEKWKIAAREEVEMIGAWRDADADNLAHYWTDGYTFRGGGPPKMPNMFYVYTTCLVGEIVARYPKLDPAPLQDVYAAIAAWYADHSAARIPPQPVLFATLERAMMTLQAIEHDIQSRVVYENQGKVNSRGLESAPINYQLYQSGQDGIALPELPAAPAEAEGKDDARGIRKQEKYKWLAEAMLLVNNNPGWSDAEVARRVGRHPSTLSRSWEYRRAAALAREKAKRCVGYIQIDSDTKARAVEASDEAESIYRIGEPGGSIDEIDARIDAEMDAKRNATRNGHGRKAP